jgi:hypothetical protein
MDLRSIVISEKVHLNYINLTLPEQIVVISSHVIHVSLAQEHFLNKNCPTSIHCIEKKVIVFPVPRRDATNQTQTNHRCINSYFIKIYVWGYI